MSRLPTLLAALPCDFTRRRAFAWAVAHSRSELAQEILPDLRSLVFNGLDGYPIERSLALHGDLPLLRAYAQRRLDLDGPAFPAWNFHGETLLHCAAQGGRADVVDFLLELGVDPLIENRGKTALHYASLSSLEACRSLVAAGVPVDIGVGAAGTPLATGYGLVDCAEFLLDQGADPNSLDAEGVTPLMKAVRIAKARLLLAAGADISRTDLKGRDALSHAASRRRGAETIPALIEAGAKTEHRCAHGLTAMGHAILSHGVEYPHNVEALITGGSDLEEDLYRGGTPLAHACLTAQLPVIEVLLAAGANVNCLSSTGETILTRVRVATGRAPKYFRPKLRKVAQLLLAAGARA